MQSKCLYVALLISLMVLGCSKPDDVSPKKAFPVPKINLKPHKYIIYKTNKPLTIDGKLNENAWKNIRWTSGFVNITGDTSKAPEQKTRAKLLWNKNYLYIGLQLQEKNIWATMTKHDAPLYLENACEIFIDPDGDTHHYLEFGINALSTTYDLLLPKPYRDDGYPITEYNIRGLKAGVSIDGTIDNPNDIDKRWTVELAFPLKVLAELNLLGDQNLPKAGDQWRVQFARVERHLTVAGGQYTLKQDPKTNKPLPPTYSSWAPQGLVNLHYPEMWGFVQFSNIVAGHGKALFTWHQYEKIKWALRKVYYREKQYHLNHDSYTDNPSRLNISQIEVKGVEFSPDIQATKWTFTASSPGFNKKAVWLINQTGKVWSVKNQ